MSERGIALAVAEWSRSMTSSDGQRQQPIIQELGEAALTPPIDLERLERALEADAAFHAAHNRAVNQSSMRVMRALDPADRVIFGRRLTTLQPARPRAACAAARP
ncbi:MAG TPA: hypothetical protein VGW40_10125 [Allosphingosinicella sp.]|nr:hypothetical protein [Allosphingosinicella sp.]